MIWPEVQLLDCLRDFCFTSLKAGGVEDIGLVTCDVGDWQVPSPTDLATILPALILVPGDLSTVLADDRNSVYMESTIELNYLRALGPTESPAYEIKKDTAHIKRAITPATLLRWFPGWLPIHSEQTKFVPALTFCKGGGMQEGFFSEDPALEIEHEKILLHYSGDLYYKQ